MTRTTRMGARVSRWCAAVLGAALLVFAPAVLAAPVPGGTLTLGITADPITLDPHASAYANTYLVGSLNLIESLVYQQPDGKIVPWLASSYRVSPDGRTFTFVLRQDVRFTDGATFDANTVKWNLDRIVNPNFHPGRRDHGARRLYRDDRGGQPHRPGALQRSVRAVPGVRGGRCARDAVAENHAHAVHRGRGPRGRSAAARSWSPSTSRTITSRPCATPTTTGGRPGAITRGPRTWIASIWKIVPEPGTRAVTVQSGETQMIYVLGYGAGGARSWRS